MDADSTLAKHFDKNYFFDYDGVDKEDAVAICMLESYKDYLRMLRKFPYPRWKDGKIVRFYMHQHLKDVLDQLEEAPF